jgi:hypothetical protein
MNGSNTSRLFVWTGPLFAVALIVADLLAEGSTPGESASGAQVMTYFNAHRGRTLTEVFLAPVLVALLVLFASELRARARSRGEDGVGSTVMLSGAVLLSAGALLGAAVQLGAVSASDHGQVQAAETFNVLNNDDWMPFIAGLAVFLVGAGLTVLRCGLLPKWLGWVALVAGVISLAGPGGFVGYFVAPVWMVVAGAVLGIRREPNAHESTVLAAASGRQSPVPTS